MFVNAIEESTQNRPVHISVAAREIKGEMELREMMRLRKMKIKEKENARKRLDEKSDTYTMSAYLIAQLGKNFSESEGKNITGGELLKLAWDKIKEIQYLSGDMITFLEAENEKKLLSFYQNNRFSQFDTRQTESDTNESHELIQLLRLL